MSRVRRAARHLLLLSLAAVPARAQSPEPVWTTVRETGLQALRPEDSQRVIRAGAPTRTLRLDWAALRGVLAGVPMEGTAAAQDVTVELTLPMPDGTLARFRVVESPIMEPDLAAQYPEIKTYAGVGLDDPAAYVRFDTTPAGFHAMILSPATGTVFVDPRSRTDVDHYVTYFKRDYTRRTPTNFRCLVTGKNVEDQSLREQFGLAPKLPNPVIATFPNDSLKKTYRLLLGATEEYGAAVCGGPPNNVCVQSAMTTTVGRVDGIYETELGVHLTLVNNTSLIFLNASTEPYTNNDGAAMLCQNPQVFAANGIAPGSYDIGHVFSTGGGGIAALGVVCNDQTPNGVGFVSCSTTGQAKAMGVTGNPSPIGDSFDVDYVAHEMGHEFGANHPFNGTTGACGGGNRNASTAFEPGSGSTIMAYAGICGSQDLQPHSDPYFHAASLQEIADYIGPGGDGNVCKVTSGGDPAQPTISVPTNSQAYTIPRGTPFTLTAQASDPDGDPITYDWEELDLGAASTSPSTDTDATGVRPILRSFNPTTSGSRTFPKMSDILNGTSSYGESLPTRTRDMLFRVTVRDFHNASLAGGWSNRDVTLHVRGDAGPFAVTFPNVATDSLAAGGPQTIKWNATGTGAGTAVNVANVKISLSTDSGNTFTVLAASVPNTGTADVAIPSMPSMSTARIKIEAIGNVFFTISKQNFKIGPGVAIADAAPVVEGNAGTVLATFVVTVQPTPTNVSVTYATASGTAASGTDFTGTTGTVTFGASNASQTANVTVQVKGDTLYEGNETFSVNLSSAVGAVITRGSGTGTITNDDVPPSVTIANASLTEGQSSVHNMSFTVTLSTLSGLPATVQYATSDGTATAGSDYTAVTGTLTIPAGQSTHTLAVPIKGDAVTEADETFTVTLSNPVGATLGAPSTATGTIVNDDFAGTFSFAAPTFVASENAGTASIKVSRVNGLASGATVDYQITPGSAAPGLDYSGASSGTLSFAGNATFATFSIPIVKDTFDEPNETVLLRILNPTGAQAAVGAQNTAVLSITDDDVGGKIQFSTAAYVVKEAGGQAVITVKRTGGVASGVTVDFATSNGSATAGSDYTATNGTLSFAANAATATFAVPIASDGTPEGPETVNLTLTNPTNGAVLGAPATAVLTITDDDASLDFSAPTYTVKEGTAKATITVKRNGTPTTTAATVDYATANGSAVAGTDYTATSGTLSFAANVLQQTFSIPIANNTTVDAPRTVSLSLANAVGVPVGDLGTATLTITDNDVAQTLQFSAAAYNVAEKSPKVVATVTRKNSTTGTVTVDYATGVGSATAGTDYDATNGTLTFGPGIASRTFSITIHDNTAFGDKQIPLQLSNLTGGAIAGAPVAANVVIVDDDSSLKFAAPKYTVSETAASVKPIVMRVGSRAVAATVDYVITAGTATAGLDFGGSTSGTLTFAPNVSSQAITIPIVADTIDEPNETFTITLQNPTGPVGLATQSSTVVTITDNDTAGKVQFNATNYSVAEDAGTATITVTRTGGTSSQATVQWQASGGATASGTLTFGLGVSSQTFTVPITDNGTVGPNPPVVLTLSSPGNGAVLGTPSTATLWIVDND